MSESSRIFFFLIAGTTGFVVDAVVLSILVHAFDWSPYVARLLSYAIAVTATWYLNRTLTFRDRSGPDVGQEYLRYGLVQTAGITVNYGIYSAVIALWDLAASWPAIALVPASLVAMFVTYAGMHWFAFPQRQAEPIHD